MILLVFLLHQVFGEPIFLGDFSNIQSYPWLASIQKDGYHYCGGSIIASSVILTAAHCVDEVLLISLEVRVGSSRTDSGGSLHRVVSMQKHRKYQPLDGNIRSFDDIALIKVWPPFEFNRNLKKVQLAEEGHIVRPGTVVSAAGWGTQEDGGPSSQELKSTNLEVTDSGDCARAYADETGMQMSTNGLICAFESGGDTCDGDSGGPILDGDVQVGIVSWGSDCGNVEYPGVYVDVGSYRVAIDASAEVLEAEEPDRTFIDGALHSIKTFFG